MDPKPITRQRSPWTPAADIPINGCAAQRHTRRVHDGALQAFVAQEPGGWHMSISFTNHRGKPSRYPSWDEIVHARDVLLPPDVAFVMRLPATGEYVAVHPTTFHLFEHPERNT